MSSANRNSHSNYEGSIELREIREIRDGKNSKEFDKWPEEARRADVKACFVIFYGSEFKLKCFSVAGTRKSI